MGGSGIAGDVLAGRRRAVHAGAGRRREGLRAPGLRRRAHAGVRRLVLGQHRGDRRGASPRRPRRRARRRRDREGGELARAGGGVGRAGPRRCPTASRCRAPASARSPSRRSSCSSSIGLFPGARGGSRPPSSSCASARPARRPRATPPSALARRIGRTMPIIYGGGADRRGGRDAVEDQFNENAKAPAFSNRRARAVPQRDRGLGPARRRDPPGVHASSTCATTSSTRRSPAGSSS